jgi:hypothetical protein
MIQTIFHLRSIDNKDWATIVFVLALVLIAMTKYIFENRFKEFSKLIFSDKYIKIYKDTSSLMSWFNVILFVVQLISFAFFIQIVLAHFGIVSKTDGIIFIRIITLLGVFILSKFTIEKIIATAFNIEEFEELINFYKVSYRSYIAVCILPINLILFYNDNTSQFINYAFMGIVISLNLFTYLISLKNYQNLLFSKMFYFILYLCTLEIAPYYFLYYWITKS